MLPSDYISSKILRSTSGSYIDTGVKASSKLKLEISFGSEYNAGAYVFGARDSSSNTANGQFNFYLGSTSYFGYYNARTSKSVSHYNGGLFHITANRNDCDLVNANEIIYEFKGATNTFDGNYNVHLFGLNNAGTHSDGILIIYGCRIFSDGALVRDFVPVYKVSTSKFGMYDLVSDTFYGSPSGDFATNYVCLVETDETDGGEAYLRAEDVGLVKKQYAGYRGSTLKYYDTPVTAVARALEGYVFDHWEINGTFVSNDLEYTFQPTTDTTIKAFFTKETAEQRNPYHAVILEYGAGVGSLADTTKSATYVKVLRGDINEDLLQRSTSTFECLEIPSTVQINSPLFLFNPKGRIIYYGVIKAIEGNKLTCREPICLYDDDHLQITSQYKNYYTTLNGVYSFMQYNVSGAFGFNAEKHDDLYVLFPSQYMPVKSEGVPSNVMASIDKNGTVNGEDYLLNAYSDFGIAIKYDYYLYDPTHLVMSATPFLPASYDKVDIADNFEYVSDINLTIQEADTTDLIIYSSDGSTYRGQALMKTNGTIEIFEAGASTSGHNLNDFVADTICKQKIVFSDDGLKTVSAENLNGALYSHKINFNLAKNDLLRFEDLHLGQYVDFYYKGNLYNSVITAWSYSFEDATIRSMNITMGNVRTTLTAILNKKNKKK